MAVVKNLLLETLNDLKNEDLQNFKQTLDLIVDKKKPRYFPLIWSPSAGRAQTVEQMMEIFGQQCLEITVEVLKDINRTDLRQRLTKPCFELKEMYSVDEHRPAQSEGAQIAAVKPILFKALVFMSDDELHRFQWYLQFTYFQKRISCIFHGYSNWAESALQLVDQMVETCGPQSVEVTREVLMDLDRTDLVERLSKPILRPKALEHLRFETLKGSRTSHLRAHLQPLGVEYSKSKGSPIDLLHHQATSSLLGPPPKRLKSSSMRFPYLGSSLLALQP
ncbi:uncharacterized protein, partial [Notothenia coriiceps]|uniref:Pyrin domain-containing protein n=1 Tax=Notothenia coriiceps TaxID=8208 RepID=A0A6I9MWW9_9TELE